MRLLAGQHLILVGLPGSGKTVTGRVLADLLARPFVDFDEEIVRRTGLSVATIFARRGEAGFRALEAELTRELAEQPAAAVLAPGGGWVAQHGLPDLLRPRSVMVHLRVAPATALRRMGAGHQLRPLLAAPDPLDRLLRLWEERRAAYEAAELEVDTELLSPQAVAGEVLRLIEWSAPSPD